MFFLALIWLALWYIVYFNAGTYRGELAISFLPYRAGGMLIGLLLSVWRLRVLLYRKPTSTDPKVQKIWLFTRFSAGFVLGFGVIFALFTLQFRWFYQGYKLTVGKGAVKVLFSNLYKGNEDYDQIFSFISQNSPDVVMFVEFEEHHYQHLKEALSVQYAHLEYLPASTSLIASKYPITFYPTSLEGARWRYYFFSLQKEDQTYYGYLVHTSSPTSHQHFLNRNQQLSKVAEDFLTLHAQIHPVGSKIFMVGDFNITPWSRYYAEFSQLLSAQMDNATRSFPMLVTWNLAKLLEVSEVLSGVPELLFAHIDQLFVSPALQVTSLEKIQLSGSDHAGFLFEIR